MHSLRSFQRSLARTAFAPLRVLPVLLVLAAWAPAAAQEPPAPAPSPPPLEDEVLDVAAIRSRLALVEKDTQLDDEQRQQARKSYEAALQHLDERDRFAQRAAAAERLSAAAPAELERIRAALSQPPAAARAEPPPDATLADLEELLRAAEQRLETARDEVRKLKAEQARRTARRAKASQELAVLKKTLEDLDRGLATTPPAELPRELVRATRAELRARREALLAQVGAIEAELASFDAERDLLRARLDLATREEGVAEKTALAWQTVVGERRQLEAERAKAEAEKAAREAEERLRRETTEKTPQLLALANENRTLANLRTGEEGTAHKLAEVDAELTALRQQLADVRASFGLLRRKVKVAGVTNAIGQLLRKKLDELPDEGTLARRLAARQELLADVQYQLILREEERLQAGDIAARLAEAVSSLNPEERARVEDIARELLTARRDLLDALIEDYTRLFDRMVELDATTRQLIEATSEYRAYLEERILWVRSVAGSALPSPAAALEGLRWIVAPRDLGDAVPLALRAARVHWPEATLWVLLLLLLLVGHPVARAGLERSAESVWKPQRDDYGHTLRALVFTLLLALPVPTLLWGLSWFLARPQGQSQAAIAIAQGLRSCAELLLGLELVRRIFDPRGLGVAHFRWRSSSLGHLRWHLRWFTPAVLVTAYVVVTLDALHEPRWNDSLGRMALTVQALVYSVFVYRTLRPSGPVMANYLKRHRSGWIARLRYVWYPLSAGLPLCLAVISLRGYHYTALKLLDRTQASLWLVAGLILAHALLLRWLRLARTRLIHQQIAAEAEAEEARRAAEEAARAAAAALETVEAASGEPAAEAEVPSSAGAGAGAAAKGGAGSEEGAASPPASGAASGSGGEEPSGEDVEGPASTVEKPAGRDAGATPSAHAVTRRAARFGATTRGARRPSAVLDGVGAAREVDGSSAITIDLDEVDHAALSSQSQRFFRTLIALAAAMGFFWLWADVLPALRRLDQIQVWPEVAYLEAEEQALPVLEDPNRSRVESPSPATPTAPGRPGAGPAPAPAVEDLEQAIPERLTLADVGLALLAVVLTVLAAQTLPGLLEFLLLSRVALDSGTRYAISTVARYTIVLVGASVSLGMIGFRWDSIQWLAAALTFGLAFGLQEIFANFVSGLIILFERPIRLGDWVTVGDITGVVSRIRIRATTILDRDRKELIIPNKTFVTGNVINWGLTDSVVRLTVPVGVAYGTDPDPVRAALLSVAGEHPRVLKDPAPEALFLGFGDSTLNWELHAFVSSPADLYRISDQLHSAIARRFAAEGIEIAFPQVDLHLRSDNGLVDAIREARGPAGAPHPSWAEPRTEG